MEQMLVSAVIYIILFPQSKLEVFQVQILYTIHVNIIWMDLIQLHWWILMDFKT
jgi:hypothetical protein